ncbi:MAG: hypothetical protein WC552_05890 [Candidatus Omnitrophota bacterium]
MKKLCFIFLCLAFLTITAQAREITLTTVVPAPGGNFSYSRYVPTATTPSCPGDGTANGTLYYSSTNSCLEICVNGTYFPVNIMWKKTANNVYLNDINDLVGIGTLSPSFRLTIDNDGGILAKGTYGSGVTAPAGAGTRFMWYPRKAALRAGNVAGAQWDNANIGEYTVAFGQNNTASGSYSTVAGGLNNTAGFPAGWPALGHTTVSGGSTNQALGQYDTVGGGLNNVANSGLLGGATVTGGVNNQATFRGAFVGSGYQNTASGLHSNVVSGADNQATMDYASIGGGNQIVASGYASTVSGGQFNQAQNGAATVGGGERNIASGEHSTVAGGGGGIAGDGNTASAAASTIAGGRSNTASGQFSFVGGGQSNTASNNVSSVLGGYNNTASGQYSTVSGGAFNTALGANSWAGGKYMKASGDNSFVWGIANSEQNVAQANVFIIDPNNGGINVGIGTPTPTQRLHVNGTAKLEPYPMGGLPACDEEGILAAHSDGSMSSLCFCDGSGAWQQISPGGPGCF